MIPETAPPLARERDKTKAALGSPPKAASKHISRQSSA
jgi:hypothetical protein